MYYLVPIIAVFGFYNISLKIKDKLRINYDSLLFSLTLFLITLLIFTNLIFFKINLHFVKEIILFVFTISTVEYFYIQRFKIKSIIYENKISFFIYLLLAAISLIPLAGADSYAYHLAWPQDILSNPKIIFDKLDLEYRVVGNGEVVNYLGLFLGTENLQSFISLTILFFFILNKKNKNLIFLIIICSPVFLKYCLDQKPFILPCLILSIIMSTFLKNIIINKINNFELISFFLALVFFSGSKYPFLVLGLTITIIFLILSIQYKFFKNFLFFGIIIFVFYFLPVPISKFLEFGDPFSPFLEEFLNEPNPDILKLKSMYASWDGLKISDETSFFTTIRNILNFIIPIAPFSILDTYGFGFLMLFFYRFNNKLNYFILTLLFIVTTVMVITTNFQSRWYIFLILYVLLNHDYLSISEKYLRHFRKIFISISIIILSFYSYFLGFVIYNSTLYSFEDTKNKTLYLYKEIKEITNNSEDKLILTNTRTNFYSTKLIQYKYPEYSKKYILNNSDIKDIGYAFFSIGNQYKNENELKNKSILKNFYPDCYEIVSFSKNLVAKRNLFSRKDYEQFLLIKFNKDGKNCLR